MFGHFTTCMNNMVPSLPNVLTRADLMFVSLRVKFRCLYYQSFQRTIDVFFFHFLENVLGISGILEYLFIYFKLCSIVSTSFSKRINFPEAHNSIQRSSAFRWFLDFKVFEGFCNRKFGVIMVGLNAVSFNDEFCNRSFVSLFRRYIISLLDRIV